MSDKKFFAGLIAVAIGVWLVTGSFGGAAIGASEVDPEQVAASTEIPLVRGMESVAEERRLFLEVRAQTRANRTVHVRSEVMGRVEAIPGEKGMQVEKGDLLCQIAIDTREADLNQARADLKSARLEYEGLIDLKERGLQSDINVARAEAALAAARARLKQSELSLDKTQIVAPFTGVVDQQPVEVGDYLSAGQVCVTLMEVDPMLVVGQVAERSVGRLALGDEVEVELITGESLQGRVSFIGRAPDDATRTYPVEVTVPSPGSGLRAGLSAEMRVPVGRELAHLISPASLVLSDDGIVGVRIVDEADTVRFRAVDIVSESPDGVWVKGLPNRVKLITIGQEDVFEGPVVRIDLTPLTAVVRS